MHLWAAPLSSQTIYQAFSQSSGYLPLSVGKTYFMETSRCSGRLAEVGIPGTTEEGSRQGLKCCMRC